MMDSLTSKETVQDLIYWELWNHEKHTGEPTHFVISAFNTKLLSHFSLNETTLKCESSDRNGTKAKKQILITPFSYCSLQVVIKRFTDLL